MPWLWSAAVAAALEVLYLFLTPAVSGESDGSEFTLVLATGGVAHPTGYPLFTLIGHPIVALLHRLGANWPFAANAFCGLGASLAMGLFHALAARVIPERSGLGRGTRFGLALIPTLLLGLNPVWTDEATTAEVYSWHAAWVCGAMLYWLGMMRELASDPAEARRKLARNMLSWGFLCGIGGAHHVTAIFFAGPLTVALLLALRRARLFRGWIVPAWLGAGMVPLLSYGYIAYRAFHPAVVQWDTLAPSLASALTHIRGGSYVHFLGGWHPLHLHELYLAWYVYPYLIPGLGILFIGSMNRKSPAERTIGLTLFAAAALQLVYNYNYGVRDPLPYFLPSLATSLLVLAPLGAALVARLRGRAARLTAAAAAVAGLGVATWFWMDSAIYRKGLYEQLDERFHRTWMTLPERHAMVLWYDDMVTRLREYQLLRGEKPGLAIYSPVTLTNTYPREVFKKQWGFDPLEDVTPYTQREPVHPDYDVPFDPPAIGHVLAIMNETLARRAGMPVYYFEPEHDRIRLLPVPGQAGGSR